MHFKCFTCSVPNSLKPLQDKCPFYNVSDYFLSLCCLLLICTSFFGFRFFTCSLVGACMAQLSYAIVECLGYRYLLDAFPFQFTIAMKARQKPRNKPTKFEGITIFLIIVGVIQCTFFVRMPNTNNRPAPNLPTGSDIQGRASVEPPANPCKARPTRVFPQGL